MKKNKSNIAVKTKCQEEAARFTELAKDLALELLRNPAAADAEKKKQLAHDHLIRAESFKTAAGFFENLE